jgi:DNA polymerase I-like protein with 3'-5' exonuclease and polymerase domains
VSLDAIFAERMKLPRIALEMERNGVTINANVMEESARRAKEESKYLGSVCKGIAESYNFNLNLPKAGRNDSLRKFLLDVIKLPPIYNKKSRTENPTINKDAISEWLTYITSVYGGI